MSRLNRTQCLVCCKMYDTQEEVSACTHQPDEPDLAATFVVSPAWGLARLFKKHAKEVLVEAQDAAGQVPSVADELAKLAELHRSGALTDEEFSAYKANLLTPK